MKTKLATATLAASLLATAPLLQAEPTRFQVDDEHFSMVFEVMHIGYAPVMGMFQEVEGEFVYDEQTGELSSGELVFKANSVFSNHKKRDDHLRNKDFLDTRRHKDITFSVTGFERTGDNTGIVTGDLTLLGKTNPVDVDVTLNKADVYPFGHKEYTLGLSASAVIKRSDWGMTYGIDQGMVGDEVVLRFAFEAIKDD